MKYIGLTGGIGSGKSTIARILLHLGYPVYISDKEAARLINTHPDIRKELCSYFGPNIYTGDHLNKKCLADIIFHDKTSLKTVNGIVHPRVMKDFVNWSKQQSSPLVFFESAILHEAGLASSFHHTICVTASEEERIRRVTTRDNTTPEQVKARIHNQDDEQRKIRLSDFIIYNDRQHGIIQQLLDIIQKIQTQ